MWARIASFEGGDFERLREESDRRMASGDVPADIQGMLVLVDRDRNRRLFVTMFESREAIEAAESKFESMGDEIPEDVRGRRTGVDYYEVAHQQ